MSELRFERVSGEALIPYLPELARLRIQVFREYPYLYDGDMDYEARYLKTYSDTEGSVVVLAWDDDKIVGAATGVPITQEIDAIKTPLADAEIEPDEVFYCGESVLLPEYRGQGAGVKFFDEREAHARDLGGFKYICFCAVDRSIVHPARPQGYVPLNSFWQNRGYQIQAELKTEFSWKDLGEKQESPKPMTFWMKEL